MIAPLCYLILGGPVLALAYLEAHQATGDPFYRRVAEETLDYVLREMTHPEGGFYSAEDADSEGREGKFYCWTRAELQEALGHDRLAGLEARPYFHDFLGFLPGDHDPRGKMPGGDLHVDNIAVARAQQVEDLAALIEAAGGSASLVGLSSGGAMAMPRTGSHTSGIEPEASSASSALSGVNATNVRPNGSKLGCCAPPTCGWPATNTTRSMCAASLVRDHVLASAARAKAVREALPCRTPRARVVITCTAACARSAWISSSR